MDSKQRLKRFNVISTVVMMIPTIALVVYAVLSKTLDWPASANLVAFVVCGVVVMAAFVVMTRRAGTLMREMPVRENGAPYDPASPTVSVREIERYERAHHMLRTRRGRFVRVGPVALVAVLAIASAILPTSAVTTMMVFMAGFATLSIERSISSLRARMERGFNEAQYQPRWWMVVAVALTWLRWIVLVAFGAISVGVMASTFWLGLLFFLGGISGWFAVRYYNTLFDRSIDIDHSGMIRQF